MGFAQGKNISDKKAIGIAITHKEYDDMMNYQSYRLMHNRPSRSTFETLTPDESEARPEQKTIHSIDHKLTYILGAVAIILVAGIVYRKMKK